MRAVQINEFGGPEVLEVVDVPDPVPGEGETLVRVARSGINFADTHQRHNSYLAKAELPLIPGAEVAGTTPDGRRVAAVLANGGYAELVAVPDSALVPIPDGVGFDEAAAILLQGLTAWALLRVSAHVEPGETVVVEGAAGGTGTLVVQLAKAMGARVIGLASSEEKRRLVADLGADATADSRAEDAGAAIRAANDGADVDVVMQMSGGAAFDQQMEVLAPFGRMVAFGIATREPNEIRSQRLMRASRSVVGFWIVHLLQRPDLVRAGTEELFASLAAGDLRLVIGATYPLERAAEAQVELAERRTQGKLLLDPVA
jgi:NADPH2:quinone reductase